MDDSSLFEKENNNEVSKELLNIIKNKNEESKAFSEKLTENKINDFSILQQNAKSLALENELITKINKKEFARVFSRLIKDLISLSINFDSHRGTSNSLMNGSIFESIRFSEYPISNYFCRIVKYTEMEKSTIILTGIYIDLFCNCSQTRLTNFNVHRYSFN